MTDRDQNRGEPNPRPTGEQAEGRFRQAIESLPHAVLLADRQGKILFVNAHGEELFGYAPGELTGQFIEVLLPSRFRTRHREFTDNFFSNPQPRALGRGRDLHGVRKDGSEFAAEVGLGPLHMPEGLLVLCAVVDVSERKHLESELAARNRDLETLLYVTSHDLREPLRSISGFCQLLKDRYADKLDGTGQDFLRRVMRAAERLDRLLLDNLTLSRAQRVIEPSEHVKGAEIVAAALRQLETRVRETCARVRVAPDLPTFRADRRWAVQALYNLLSNAVKFTRVDDPPEIEVVAYEPDKSHGSSAGLMVRDRGPGVPPHLAERIFGLFERAVGQEVEGTGAGLAIVQQVAERHGGAAWVRSRDGGGSDFIITFAGGRS